MHPGGISWLSRGMTELFPGFLHSPLGPVPHDSCSTQTLPAFPAQVSEPSLSGLTVLEYGCVCGTKHCSLLCDCGVCSLPHEGGNFPTVGTLGW